MNKKILYISYDGMTDPLGEGQVINYLIGLSKLGYNFDILSFEKPDKFASQQARIGQILKANNINWHPQVFHTTPPIISKIYDKYLIKQKAKTLYKQHKYHFIHCRSYMAAEVGLMLKKEYNVPFLFDMRGFWADEKADGGAWNRKNFFWNAVYNFYKKKERSFITETFHIISLTYAGKKEIESWPFYNNKIGISVIPCCVDTHKFELISDEKKMFAKHKNQIPQNAFVISYLGSLGAWYMVNEMLGLFSKILATKPNAIFFIITNSNHSIILNNLEKYSISTNNVKLITVPFNEVPINMYASDYSLSFIKPVYSKISSSPVKIGEILSMGIPIIANAVGDIQMLLTENNVGFLIPKFEPNNFDSAVNFINNVQPPQASDIRQVAINNYSLQKGITLYGSVYDSITQG